MFDVLVLQISLSYSPLLAARRPKDIILGGSARDADTLDLLG